jgi:hypothetical protein
MGAGRHAEHGGDCCGAGDDLGAVAGLVVHEIRVPLVYPVFEQGEVVGDRVVTSAEDRGGVVSKVPDFRIGMGRSPNNPACESNRRQRT